MLRGLQATAPADERTRGPDSAWRKMVCSASAEGFSLRLIGSSDGDTNKENTMADFQDGKHMKSAKLRATVTQTRSSPGAQGYTSQEALQKEVPENNRASRRRDAAVAKQSKGEEA
jgi:hypothetical protein